MPENQFEEALYVVADVGIIAGLLLGIAFVVSYMAFFNWKKYPAGRAVMVLACSYLSVATIAALARWIGQDYFARAPLRLIVWWSIPVAFIWLLKVLWSKHRSGETGDPLEIEKKDREDDHEHS